MKLRQTALRSDRMQLVLPISGSREAFDPHGAEFCEQNSSQERRSYGITLTPEWLVRRMVNLASRFGEFDRVVDAGCGTGRFALAAAERFRKAMVVGIETHAELVSLAQSAASAHGLTARVNILEQDYRSAELPTLNGRTLFIGNPPYVRHHDIDPDWKGWYQREMARLGIKASALAGLHAHFLLRTLQLTKPGDAFCFVTSAEWLDTKYGAALRDLLVEHLCVAEMWLAEKSEPVFSDALVSTLVFTGTVGSPVEAVRLRRLHRDDQETNTFRTVNRSQLAKSERWSELWAEEVAVDNGQVELGEVFAVHRGQVTGNNALWTYGKAYREELPDAVLKPCVTRARELFDLGTETLDSTDTLKRVVDIPADWEQRLHGKAAADVSRFLDWCERRGGRDSYIAAHRQPWYSLRLGRPAPVLMTYMARRPPRFVLNAARAGILNIAHGLFPRADVAPSELRRIVMALNSAAMLGTGRAYAGNLIKFEPSDAMRLRFRMPAEAGE